jgi:hypothetical protein
VTNLIMFDAIDLAQIPVGPAAAAGYVDGAWPTYAQLAARHPHARLLSIAVSAAHDADCLDIETGDATPADAVLWWERQRGRGTARPCLYASASVMEASLVPLVRSGAIARPLVRLWSAHYSGQHICGPRSCGGVSIDADGCQWTDRAWGRDLDESLLVADFFAAPAAPGPKPAPSPVPAWQEAMMNALPVVKLGDTGEAVRTVQGLCIARGHQVTVDGDFGPATHEAVTAVQAAARIAQDGSVGPATWPALAGV